MPRKERDTSKAAAPRIHHALGLHMHQPPGNLRLLLDGNEWEAQQIIRCYERVPRYARTYRDVARLHVGFSGILLEQLLSPTIVDRYRQFVDIPAMLHSYREAENIEPIGMGYYHPIFPLIPREDWDDQLRSGRQIAAEVFGRAPRGFWPPEMAFDMEMIPALVAAGYEYVVVDGVHVRSTDESTPLDPYRPYVGRRSGAEIVVIPRDRDISNAQESGMDAGWFLGEVTAKVGRSPSAETGALVTTWSDGENGGWFRQTAEEAGFFGHFFAPYIERVRSGNCAVRPTLLSEYLSGRRPREETFVRTGAWNVSDTSGYDFSQWAGSEAQRKAIEEIFEGETSCYLFWGDAWIPRLYERTDRAAELLSAVETAL
jgi:alpha-amylase/alpha-mannosidase (GH57 family)